MGSSGGRAWRTMLCVGLLLSVGAVEASASPFNPLLPTRSDAAGENTTPQPSSALELPAEPGGLPGRRENLEVVGRLEPTGRFGPILDGQIADLSVHKGYAYLNSWDNPNCERGGTYVVDIRTPSRPREVGFIPAPADSYHGEGAHAISLNLPGFRGDVLAVNNETYGSNVTAPCSPTDKTGGGFDLYDVTNPASPRPLVQSAGDIFDDEDPTTPLPTKGISYHSVFAWQDGPRAYLVASDNIEATDLDIFDITNPRAPELIADVNISEVFPQVLGQTAYGDTVLHHDVVVKRVNGRMRMLVSYWDAGYVQLDVSNPASPRYITDTSFDAPDLLTGFDPPEGNAHQAEFSYDNQYILAADEDFGPYRLSQKIAGVEADPPFGFGAPVDADGVPIDGLQIDVDEPLTGGTLYVGDACDPATIPVAPAATTIAVSERGTCSFEVKTTNAEAAGYDGLVIFSNNVTPLPPGDNTRCEGLLNMIFTDPPVVSIKSIFVGRATGLAILGVLDPATYSCVPGEAATTTPAPPVGTVGETLDLSAVFDGWGYGHLYDARTSAELDAFAIQESLDPRYDTDFGDLSIHEFATDPTENLAYSSYYAGGIRVLRYSRGGGLEPVGAWIDDQGSNFWGVEQFTTPSGERLIAGSDRDYGLVILRYTGPGAAKPPSCSNSSARTRPRRPVELALTCTDPNGNPLRRRIVSGPANGTLGPIQGDSVLYTPNRGFRGSDAVRFVANDGAADSQPATASVTVRRPSNRVRLKIGRYKNGRVIVVVRVPGPGLLRVGMRANLPRGQASAAKVKRLARVTKRPRRAGRVRVVLKLSRAERRQMARVLKKRRVKAKINTSFKPTGGTTGKRSRTLVIPRKR